MKTLFLFMLLFGTTFLAMPQHTWLPGQGNVSLYSPTDKVGIGTTARLNEKLVIQSLAGETPLALRGYSTQTGAFLSFAYTTGNPFWKIFASPAWWAIGGAFDSTLATISVKPSLGWIRFNGTGYFTKIQSPTAAVTTATITTGTIRNSSGDTLTINKFFKMAKNSTTPASTLGNFYLSATDSCLYYYNGKAWKKFTTQ